MSKLILCWILGATFYPAGDPDPATSQAGDTHDLVILFAHRPVSMRIIVTLNGGSVQTARDQFIDQLVKELDTDGDGKLIRRETIRSPYLSASGQPQGNTSFFDVFRNNQIVERKDIVASIEAIAGSTLGLFEDVLPATNDRSVFTLLDSDNSATLLGEELDAAPERLRNKDVDGDGCIILPELTASNGNLMSVIYDRSNNGGPIRASMVLDISSQDLPGMMISKYDADRNQILSAEEIGWETDRFKQLDSDNNQTLDNDELKRFNTATRDIDLAVRLGERPDNQTAIEVLSCLLPKTSIEDKNSQLSFDFGDTKVTLGAVVVDPVESAIKQGGALFKQLDGNKNGYLEPAEANFQFPGRALAYNVVDADGDKMLFPEELNRYLTMRAKPAATSSKLTLTDRGHGFFQLVDLNRDGRISEREIRKAGDSLALADATGTRTLADDAPPQTVHIEFSQGTFQFFGGNAVQVTYNAVTFAESVGPLWFQRMDRNLDGDLTWGEFLGPREVFDRLDQDRDALIDPQEAEKTAAP